MMTGCRAVLTLALAGMSAHADVITVDDDGPADFETIQGAIDFAVSGDVVLVSPGAYIESIDFLGKSIEVQSVLGSGQTSIKAMPGMDLPTVTFASKENSLAVISGFKIGGGNGRIINDPVFGPSLAGGAIFCYESSPKVVDCDIVGNTIDGHGAGMLVMRGTPEISGCMFLGNNAAGHGGAIYILDGSSPQISDCLFDENTAAWGGAITCTVSCNPVLTGCTFTRNEVFNVGGAMYIRSSSSPELNGCTFTGNIQLGNAVAGGAAVTVYGSGNGGGPCFPLLTGCRFEDNDAQAYGGAVHAAYSGNITLVDCTLFGNVAGKNGGGISCIGHPEAPTTVTLTDCIIEDNVAVELGGGVDSRTSTLDITGCTITGNIADLGVGSGGGCSFEVSEASSLMDTVVCGNTPDQVAGIFQDDGGNSISDECGDPCIADIDGDGLVDGTDLTILLGSWGPCPALGKCPGDLTGDGVVDGADLTIVLGEWGVCP